MPGNKKRPVVLPTQPAMSGEKSILKPSLTEFIINHLTNKSMKFYTCFSHWYLRKWKKCKLPARLWAWLIDNRFYGPRQIVMRINLVAFFIALAMLKVTASVRAQNISLSFENAPIEKVFESIEKQSGYIFWYDKAILRSANRISIKVKNGNLSEALEQCFKNQPLQYQIVEKTIVVKEKSRPASANPARSIPIKGKVVDDKGQPLGGVNVRVKNSLLATVSDDRGDFSIEVPDENAILVLSFIGLQTIEVPVKDNLRPTVILKEIASSLEAVSVVNTGYQQIPKERATGSFVQIDNELLNRRVSTNILERLDGVTSGLIFNKSSIGVAPRNENVGISIRGRSTIDNNVSADPLIILDNFPYEGNVANINPNDIESITILKDAAAASIWGARSGNGVIVITTKKGKFGQPLKVDFNTNLTVGQKPDLFYSKSYLGSASYIEIETYLFNQGAYNANLSNVTTYPLISPAVEILAQSRAGTITSEQAGSQLQALARIDVRDQLEKYFYTAKINQQYSINLSGGSDKSTHNFSAGYDNNRNENLSRYSRLNLNYANVFKPLKNLELSTGIIYSDGIENRSKGYSPVYPYTEISGANGEALSVPMGYRKGYLESTKALGFLDWELRPLDETKFVDNTVKSSNLLLRSALTLKFLENFQFSAQYQFQKQFSGERNYQSLETYYTRDLINKYSQRNTSTGVFTYPLPKGGILSNSVANTLAHNLRTQLNFDRKFGADHMVNALAGAELREISSEGKSDLLYGYDDQYGTSVTNLNYGTAYPLNPSGLGSQTLPVFNGNVTGTINRYVSYFANASYSYKERYTVSLSGRKDGANIFGVRTNDKITPLWSSGISWNISREDFFKWSWIPYLKLRGTYGYNGNVYNGSAYLTAAYSTNSLNGNQQAQITSPPNAELRWEKIRNINLGVDFALKKNIIQGSVEIYQKHATDLIESAPLAPSSGFTEYKGNAASLRTEGVDINLTSNNLKGNLSWTTNFLANFQKDRVTSYDTQFTVLALARFDQGITQAGIFPVVGNTLFGLYSYRSAGLDPTNGDPMGYLNGIVSKDYTSIITNTPLSDLVYHGSSRPNIFGSLRNNFSYMGFSLSFNLTYKFDYYFRRRSINLNYQLLLASQHTDYAFRWQKPGDEATTTVPSLTYTTNTNRNLFYNSSDVLIEKGDHIRFQDISFGYDLTKKLLKKSPFKVLQLYSYINNVGILWRANKAGIDPDNNDLALGYRPDARTVAFGVRAQF